MRRLVRAFLDWLKYERLHHYPELGRFSRPEALRRLKSYEQQMRVGEKPWLPLLIVMIVYVGAFAVWWAILPNINAAAIVPALLVAYGMQYHRYRRLRRRVRAIIQAEMRAGKFDHCINCGYDLRGLTEIDAPNAAKESGCLKAKT